jgi:hypothetical protein
MKRWEVRAESLKQIMKAAEHVDAEAKSGTGAAAEHSSQMLAPSVGWASAAAGSSSSSSSSSSNRSYILLTDFEHVAVHRERVMRCA